MLHIQIVLTILPPRSYHPLLEMPDFKHKAMSGIEAPGLGNGNTCTNIFLPQVGIDEFSFGIDGV